MTERTGWQRRLAPLILLVVLAGAWLLPGPDWLRLATSETGPADRMQGAIDALPNAPRMLVAFDADLGTYAEIRPTVRALLDELLEADASLAFVSLTSEGRALAVAEMARLEREGTGAPEDLGFVSGAEAGLVDLSGGLAERYEAVLVIGGNDLGPRSWVEQVRPRAREIPILAVTPAVLLPEVQPYLDTGQLAAALATPRDGATWRAGRDLAGARESDEPHGLPLLVGLLIAAAVLAEGVGRRAMAGLRTMRAREAA
jgi:hypothetical protein